jgi:L-alanine-DL-glutamate epimerase-like enolase superfamily enzyme
VPAISRIDVIATAPPMPEVQFTDAKPPVLTTVTFAVLTDDTGAVGVGAVESDSFGAHDLGPMEALRPLAPALLGADPLRPTAVAERVGDLLPSASRMVPRAAVEIACWDLLGRHAGLPLHQLLGGTRDEVAAYASLPFEGDHDVLLDLVRQVRAAGYPAAKLHVSGDPAADVALVAAVREAFPGFGLVVDAESAYDRRSARLVGRALDDLDVLWFEAPLPDRDIVGYSDLTARLHTAVVPAGGFVDDVREVAQVLPKRPWSSLRTQAMEGGIAHVRDLASLGRSFGLGVELCSYGTTVTAAADLHLILGLGLGSYYEQAFPVEPWEFGTTTPIRVDRGRVRAPEGPGLGMELDHPAIDAATLDRFGVGG